MAITYGVSVLPSGSGYIYSIAPSGSITKIYTLPGNVSCPIQSVPLVEASDGDFYGGTLKGGRGYGTLFKVTKSGEYQLLYTFPPAYRAGYFPATLIEASDGNMYGTTAGNRSWIFRLTKSGQYTLIKVLAGPGGECPCQLIQGSDGVIYGAAENGAINGTVFALDLGLPKPAPRAERLHPTSGSVGNKVLIWGYNLLAASVQFNGVAASEVRRVGPNYVWATVPEGATTGPLTVTTPGGASTTKESFTVE
jgi:uncharacterized repeat protein (TIGR03803 family)